MVLGTSAELVRSMSNPTASKSSASHSSGVTHDQDPRTAITAVPSEGIELLRKMQFKDSTNSTFNT